MILDSSLVYLGSCFLFSVIFFPRLLREQWIRAKYERKEFIHSEKQEPYSAGSERHFWQISFLMSNTFHFFSSLSVCMFFILIITPMSLSRRRKCGLLGKVPPGIPCIWLGTLGILITDGNKSVIKSLSVDFHGLFTNSKSDKVPVSSFLVAGGTKLHWNGDKGVCLIKVTFAVERLLAWFG